MLFRTPSTVRLTLLTGALLCCALPVFAAIDTVEFDVQPRALRVGETTTCKITIKGSGGGGAPTLPDIPGFQLVGTSSQQSYSISPEGQQSSVSHLYQLVATQAGTFQIGPFSYPANGRNFELPAVEVKVISGSEGDRTASNRQEDFLFATLTASQTNVYIQQPVQLELALYWRELNIDQEVSLNGFDSTGLKLGAWQNLPVTREIVRDQVYEVRRFRCQAIPLTAGAFTLNPQLRVQVLVRQSRSRSDPFFGNGAFDDMFFGRFRAQPTDVSVAPLALVIRDLPAEGKPAEFSGAIGQFKLDAQAQPRNVQVGEPVTMNIRISGNGNLDTVTAPRLAPNDDFRSYEPKLLTQDQAGGQKIFEQVLIPKGSASTNLPAITFAFFNPESGRYERQTIEPISILVQGESASTRVIQHSDVLAVASPKNMGMDITHLMLEQPNWTRRATSAWYARPETKPFHALPLLALVGAYWFARRRDRLAGDPEWARRRAAPRSARRALAVAMHALEHEPAERFFESLWQLMADYFGNRFNLTPGSVNGDEVSKRLLELGWDSARIAEIQQLFAACESARFGQLKNPAVKLVGEDQQKWRSRLDRLVEWMKECERR